MDGTRNTPLYNKFACIFPPAANKKMPPSGINGLVYLGWVFKVVLVLGGWCALQELCGYCERRTQHESARRPNDAVSSTERRALMHTPQRSYATV